MRADAAVSESRLMMRRTSRPRLSARMLMVLTAPLYYQAEGWFDLLFLDDTFHFLDSNLCDLCSGIEEGPS
jgi:hypothetical protein